MNRISIEQANNFLLEIDREYKQNNKTTLEKPYLWSLTTEIDSLSFTEIANHVHNFARKKLFIFVAAKKIGLEGLAEFYLERWANSFNKKKHVYQNDSLVNLLKEQVILLKKKFIIKSKESDKKELKNQNPSIPTSILPYESLIYPKLTGLMAKEFFFSLLHKNDNSLPPFFKEIICKPVLNEEEQKLANKYAHFVKTLNFPTPHELENKDLEIFLKRYSNLTHLDLTNCENLRSYSLTMGHPNLQEVNLTGTLVNETDIPIKKFKEGMKIYKNKTSIYTVYDEKHFCYNHFIQHSYLYLNEELFKKLVNPTEIGKKSKLVNALIYIFNNPAKFYLKKDYDFKTSLFEVLCECWTKLWESYPNNKKNLFKIQKFLSLQVLNEGRIKKSVYELFLNKVFLTKNIHKKITITNEIVKTLRFISSDFLLELTYNYQNTLERYFQKPPSKIKGYMLVMHIFELYMELSHQVNGSDITLFGINPNFKNEKNRTAKVHNTTQVFAILCGLVAKTEDTKNREEFLIFLLKNFKGPSIKFRAIRDVILGNQQFTADKENQYSLFLDRLKQYKGIFNENISEELKKIFWDAIANGDFGGRDQNLIDSYVTNYQKGYTSNLTKEKILQTLQGFMKISSLKDAAQDALTKIQNFNF
ncbi:MAG: hypothetical protein BGO10_06180 [Chlamydia sp. 32-24]|nr:MAG: hypothetical protein BGO10_06180 [Chlamydia sp. 32-24]